MQTRAMKYSPSFSNVILPRVYNGSPPRSPRGPLRTLSIMHAVTLACTAAFVAGSSVLIFLSNQSDGNILGIQTHLDWPHNTAKCNGLQSRQGSEKSDLVSPKDARTETQNSDVDNGRRMMSGTQRVRGDSKADTNMDSNKWPSGVVWLMSFPNSGTSYTLHAIRELTNTTTATNYGLEGDIKDAESVTAFEDDIEGRGPFFELIPGRKTNVPNLILTKTHCGGCSTSRKPASYIETPRSFLKSCLKSKRGVYSSDSNTFETRSTYYSQDLVQKIVHLFRNPLDNVVARFHLERKTNKAKKDEKWLNEYPNSKLGFRKWCKSIDSQKLLQTRWVDTDLAAAISVIPCQAEFYRYVQWHNLAFAATVVDLQVPSMVLYYEEYSIRFKDVTNDLMNFLELEPIGVPPGFVMNKKYGDYYTKQETQAIAEFIKEFSTGQVWQHLAHYFGENGAVVDSMNSMLAGQVAKKVKGVIAVV